MRALLRAGVANTPSALTGRLCSVVSVMSIPFKDKARERQRQQKLAKMAETAATAAALSADRDAKKAAKHKPVQTVAWCVEPDVLG